MLDHGGSPDHQHAAQSFVAGSRDTAETDLARGRMILRRQADPGRKLACGSEYPGLRGLHGQQYCTDTAPIGPTPGILASRWLHSSARCKAKSLASTSSICACSCAYSLAWAANSSRAKPGRL